MQKKLFAVGVVVILAVIFILKSYEEDKSISLPWQKNSDSIDMNSSHSMDIESLRQREYRGSEVVVEETLIPGSNYDRFIASYISDGNKIYGLLTVPKTDKPDAGYPFIVFLHGYIPPKEYKTTERYVAYQDNLARNGFITFKIDLRGHGNSEGEASGAHFSEAYVVDTLNAVSSLMMYPDANPEMSGIWGHSNGGQIGLRAMAVSEDIRAGVFWAGVVGSFEGMLETYNSKISFLNIDINEPEIVKDYGLPSENPDFWRKVDPYYHLSSVGAIQLHHGTADNSVPIELSRQLKGALEEEGRVVELFEYEGGDHDLSNPAFGVAMERTVEFFKEYIR